MKKTTRSTIDQIADKELCQTALVGGRRRYKEIWKYENEQGDGGNSGFQQIFMVQLNRFSRSLLQYC